MKVAPQEEPDARIVRRYCTLCLQLLHPPLITDTREGCKTPCRTNLCPLAQQTTIALLRQDQFVVIGIGWEPGLRPSDDNWLTLRGTAGRFFRAADPAKTPSDLTRIPFIFILPLPMQPFESEGGRPPG
jgi:hypothetical protein